MEFFEYSRYRAAKGKNDYRLGENAQWDETPTRFKLEFFEYSRYRAAKGKNDYHPGEMRNGMKRPCVSLDMYES